MILFGNTSENDSYFDIFRESMPSPIVTDNMQVYLDIVLNTLILALGLFGVVTNAINIRVFIQQGLKSDSNTISLFALAIADFFGCLLPLPTGLCALLKLHKPFTISSVKCMSSAGYVSFLSHLGMSRVTCWITVYIAVERSLCVLMPFKVKALIRPKVTTASMIFLYLVFVAVYLPIYVNIIAQTRFIPILNVTITSYTDSPDIRVMLMYYGLILNTVLTNVALIVIAITTGLMLFKLYMYSKWRVNSAARAAKAATAPTGKGNTGPTAANRGKKDLEVLKTVASITGLFLVCLSMSQFVGFASAFVPGFTFSGINKNLYQSLYLFRSVSYLVNSSLNFFFYIQLSSRYKVAFHDVFRRNKGQDS